MTCIEALQAARDNPGNIGARPIGMKHVVCFYDPLSSDKLFRMRDNGKESPLWFNNRFFHEWETVEIEP